MKLFLLLASQFITPALTAQPGDIEGEFIFTRQEMVAAFNFSTDGRFEFFYSYGAVDRHAAGTFKVKEGKVILHSEKIAGKDFTILHQSRQANGYHLKFEDRNKYLLSHIRCIFKTGSQQLEAVTDNNGEVKVDYPACDSIYVQHLLFPDIVTLVKDSSNYNNTFTLQLNPSLAQVSFKGIELTITPGLTLTCLPNYFMMMEGIEFKKRN